MFTVNDVLEHRKTHSIDNAVQDMGVKEYAAALDKDAVVMTDSHGFIVDSFTGMAMAADGEQLDLLITHLETMRKSLPEKNQQDFLKK